MEIIDVIFKVSHQTPLANWPLVDLWGYWQALGFRCAQMQKNLPFDNHKIAETELSVAPLACVMTKVSYRRSLVGGNPMLQSRRHLLAGLGAAGLVPIVAGDAQGQPVGRADRAFSALAKRWVDAMLRLGPVSATRIGEHRYDHLVDDLGPSGRDANMALAKSTLTQLRTINTGALNRENQVDAALLKNNLESQIWMTETVQEWAWNPLLWQDVTSSAIYNLMARDFAPLSRRLESARRRIMALPRLLEQARANLDPARVPKPHAEVYKAQVSGLFSGLSEILVPKPEAIIQKTPGERNAIRAAILNIAEPMLAFERATGEHRRWIDDILLPNAKGEFRAGAARFDQQLGYTLMSPLSRADIRARADKAVTDVRARMYEVAREALDGKAGAPPMPASPSPEQQQVAIRAALDRAAADRPARDKLVETSTRATEIARQFVVQKDLIKLPDGPVRIILMPEFQRGFAVAYCDSPGPLEKNLDTFYAVSPIPDDWTEAQAISFTREYNNRGIQDIAVHEAMPGHYVQIFHSNRHPSLLRPILGSGSFVEGWAVYAETMMVEEGFLADDPLYELSQLKVLLRTITNAIIDQAIHVDGWSETQVMTFLTQTAFQEEREAAGKWRRAQLSVTQLSTYFVGFSEHMEARAAAKAKFGPAFKLRDYHNGILSYGSPPMRYARALYLGEALS
jgi:uncharacterized protein (DUF885 family)